jgi:hypothetical protein
VAALGARERLSMVTPFEDLFPGLRGSGYEVKSRQDDGYNYIAWAAGATNTAHWWWPFGDPPKTYWSEGVPRQESLEAFQQLFEQLGYAVCDHAELELGYEKVALFADAQGVPLHAARQLPTGRWTSKLGALEDIEHALQDLVGTEYGSVVRVMKRPVPAAAGEEVEPQGG